MSLIKILVNDIDSQKLVLWTPRVLGALTDDSQKAGLPKGKFPPCFQLLVCIKQLQIRKILS